MSDLTIRPAYSKWPDYNRALRDVVATLTEEQLATQPSPERWPLWASVGHLACQRVFWLCDFAGEPGAEATPFRNAGYDCPGDDDLEHVLSATALTQALDSTFRIVEQCLGRWDPRHARRGAPSTGLGRFVGPHARVGRPASLRPRHLPLCRPERDARKVRAAVDRLLGPGLVGLTPGCDTPIP